MWLGKVVRSVNESGIDNSILIQWALILDKACLIKTVIWIYKNARIQQITLFKLFIFVETITIMESIYASLFHTYILKAIYTLLLPW